MRLKGPPPQPTPALAPQGSGGAMGPPPPGGGDPPAKGGLMIATRYFHQDYLSVQPHEVHQTM